MSKTNPFDDTPVNQPSEPTTLATSAPMRSSSQAVMPETEQQGATEIILAGDNHGFVTETDAMMEFRARNLPSKDWTIGHNPSGQGFCLLTFKKIVELKRTRDLEAKIKMTSGAKPPEYIEVQFGPNMDQSKPDKQTEVIGVNGEQRFITLGMRAIITDADLEAIEHSTVDNWVPKDASDGRPIMRAGFRARVACSIIRRNVPKEEYQADCKRNSARFNQFQEERRTISEGVKG